MSAETVREFCQGSLEFTHSYWRPTTQPLEAVLSTVEVAVTQPNMVDYLDLLNVADQPKHTDVLALLKHLPSGLILSEYGAEMLAVVAAQRAHPSFMDEHRLKLDRHNGIVDHTISRVSRWCDNHWSGRGRDLVTQYDMSRLLLTGELENFDLSRALHDAVDDPDLMSRKRAARFAFEPATVGRINFEGWRAGSFDEVAPGVDYRVWLDTPTGFMLTYKGLPQAVAGVAISGYSSEVMIHQLQGVRGYRTGLNDNPKIERISSGGLTALDWRNVLVRAVEHIAQAMDISTIGIREGDKNEWTSPRFGEPTAHLTAAAAYAAYDRQAKRLGFSQGIDGDWHRQLDPSQSANI